MLSRLKAFGRRLQLYRKIIKDMQDNKLSVRKNNIPAVSTPTPMPTCHNPSLNCIRFNNINLKSSLDMNRVRIAFKILNNKNKKDDYVLSINNQKNISTSVIHNSENLQKLQGVVVTGKTYLYPNRFFRTIGKQFYHSDRNNSQHRTNTWRIISHLYKHKWKYIVSILGIKYLNGNIDDTAIDNKSQVPTISTANKLKNHGKLRIKNLAFQGGGPKGIGYVGALEMLDEDLLKNVERISGTSAGAIIATLLSIGYTPDKIKTLLDETNTMDFIWDGYPNSSNAIFRFLHRTIHWAKNFNNGFISPGNAFCNWLEAAISTKVAEIETGDRKNCEDYKYLTFGELQKLRKKKPERYKELFIVCGIKEPSDNIFLEKNFNTNDIESDNLIISDTVRVSISLPMIFSFQTLFYKDRMTKERLPLSKEKGVDGGILNNYPLELFDYNKYLSEPFLNKDPEAKQINFETLGFNFYKKKNKRYHKFKDVIKSSMMGMSSMLKEYFLKKNNNKQEDPRSVTIETCGVEFYHFNISSEKIEKLRHSGAIAVTEFWNGSEMHKLCEKQAKESDEKKKFLQDIVSDFHGYHKSNLSLNLPSADYTESQHTDELDSKVQSEHNCILVSGIGGVGKSSLISGYLYHDFLVRRVKMFWHKGILYDEQKKPVVLILSKKSDDENAYSVDLSAIFKNLFEKEENNFSSDSLGLDNINKIVAELEKDSHWIIVFDDCNDIRQIEPFLNRKFLKGKIIISSRNSELIPSNIKHERLHMTGFDVSDCKKLIENVARAITNIDNSGDLFAPADDPQAIIDASSGIPLYLKTAVARVYGNRIPSYQVYLNDIKKYENEPLSPKDISLGITKSQKSILLDSINSIKLHPLAYEILQFCSYIGNKNITDELIENYIKIKHKHFDKVNFQNNMHIFSRTSLIWKTHYDDIIKSQLYSIHGITQEYVREENKNVEFELMMKNFFENIPHFNNRNSINLVKHRYYGIYHFPIFLNYYCDLAVSSKNKKENLWNAWKFIGGSYMALGYYKSAMQHYKNMFDIASSLSMLHQIKSHHNVAGVWLELKNHHEAKFHISTILEILKKEEAINYGKDDKDHVLGVLKQLIGRYFRDKWESISDYTESMKYFNESLGHFTSYMEKSKNDQAELYLATAKSNIAILMLEFDVSQNQDWGLIENYLKESFRIREKNSANIPHKDLAFTLDKRARFFLAKNDLKNAELFSEKSIKMYEKILKSQENINDEAYAHSLVTFAEICIANSKKNSQDREKYLSEGYSYLNRSGSIFKKVLGENSIDNAYVLIKQGDILMAQNKLELACKNYKEVYEYIKNIDHRYKVLLFESLMDWTEKNNELHCSRSYCESAKSLCSNYYGEENNKTCEIIAKLERIKALSFPVTTQDPLLFLMEEFKQNHKHQSDEQNDGQTEKKCCISI